MSATCGNAARRASGTMPMQLAAPSLAIRSDDHRSRQYRAEQRTALRLTSQASMQAVTDIPAAM